ncbi:MAG: hypothetical protein ABEJ74_00470 [Haloferacaceae archaeon]
MSTTAAATTERTDEQFPDLTDKQQRILGYLRRESGAQTYFKSRLIAEDLGLSAKEVGANMGAIREGDYGLDIEKWGYSSGTTWKVTA